MEIVMFIYNILLIILYSIPLTLMCIFYLRTKKALYLATGILFLFYIFDNLVIYMTEFLTKFAQFYDSTFMSVPTFKTIIYAVTFCCMVVIQVKVLKASEKQIIPTVILMVMVIMNLMFIPMMKNSALKVWLYYFPCQVFTFVFSMEGLQIIKSQQEKYSDLVRISYRRLLLWTAIFSILIVIEDTIVIFNFDIYTDLLVKINNRSLTEDILSMYQSIATVRIFIPFLQVGEDRASAQVINADITGNPNENMNILEEKEEERKGFSKFYRFCKKYQLTVREQEILELILAGKNNEEISENLFISLGTAKTHIHNIFYKLDVKRRQQLIEKYEAFRDVEQEEPISHRV